MCPIKQAITSGISAEQTQKRLVKNTNLPWTGSRTAQHTISQCHAIHSIHVTPMQHGNDARCP